MRVFGLEISRAPKAPVLAPVGAGPRLVSSHPRAVHGRLAREPGDQRSVGAVESDRVRVRHADCHGHRQAGRCASSSATTTASGRKPTNPAYSPVLRKPNRYQTTVKFVEQWITSKLTAGNTYVLKQRDERGVVAALYVLDPAKVHAAGDARTAASITS